MLFQKFSRCGETETFGLMYIDALYGYALMLTHSRVEAEDLVQKTYARALEARHRLRDNSNIKSWVFTILRNLWLNQLRKRKSEPHLVEVDGHDGVADYPHRCTTSSLTIRHLRVQGTKVQMPYCTSEESTVRIPQSAPEE
jgi:RNA polymerase sigma-70 factor (ECF subfamily)